MKSNETKENTFPNLRMTILEQHWATEEPKQKETQPLPLPLPDQFTHLKMHLICAGGTLLLISITAIGIKLTAAFIRCGCRAASNITIQPIIPSAPAAHFPERRAIIPSRSQSTETVQDVLGLNQLMEFRLEDRINQVNDAIRLNHLMDFGLTRRTQVSLEAFLLETEVISPEEEVNSSQF